MEQVSGAQIKCIKTLMGKTRQTESDADAMVRGFTGLRTGSVSEMGMKEGAELIKHLKGLDPEEQRAEVMRRRLIALAYERAGLGRYASKAEKQRVVRELDGWCQQYGYKTKGLNSYTVRELPKLISQYEIVRSKLYVDL